MTKKPICPEKIQTIKLCKRLTSYFRTYGILLFRMAEFYCVKIHIYCVASITQNIVSIAQLLTDLSLFQLPAMISPL